MMLQLKALNAYYGKSHILHGVDMNVAEGEIVFPFFCRYNSGPFRLTMIENWIFARKNCIYDLKTIYFHSEISHLKDDKIEVPHQIN
jgi:hypothetical protein